MKFNLKVFKKGKPIYWIIGAVVLFVIFYMMANKGAGSSGSGGSGGQVVMQSGPSEAMQMAGLQASTALQVSAQEANAAIQAANIAAALEAARIEREYDTAGLGAQVALAQLTSGETVALAQLDTEKQLAALNVNANLLINEQNLAYSTESARVAAETNLAMREMEVGFMNRTLDAQVRSQEINAGLVAHQLETQAQMFETQSQNLIMQSLIGQTGSLKKKNRDEYAAHIANLALGHDSTYTPQRGGFNLGGLISPISNVL